MLNLPFGVPKITGLCVVRRLGLAGDPSGCDRTRTTANEGVGVKVDGRDVSMHSGFKEELKELLGDGFFEVGLLRVFIGKEYIGGTDEIRRLNKDGKLEKLVEGCELLDDIGGDGDLFLERSVWGVIEYITREIMMMRKVKKKLMKVSVNMIFIGVPIATKMDLFVARFVVINDVLVKREIFIPNDHFRAGHISLAGPTYPLKKPPLLPCIKCQKKPEGSDFKEFEPVSGARASIPSEEYWPEGNSSRVRAARAPEPTDESIGKSSFGKNPGSRRKRHKSTSSSSASGSSEVTVSDTVGDESFDEESLDERNDSFLDFVVYQTKPKEEEELTGYILDKKIGRHAFIDPKSKKPIEEPLTSEELWWNWRKPDKEQRSRWQRRRPDVEMVFLKAMAETGQVKLYGDHPTLTECLKQNTKGCKELVQYHTIRNGSKLGKGTLHVKRLKSILKRRVKTRTPN
ncbi:uncharacterized protein at3g28850 [Phtheirospermum japonicum]|uniref:Uncharacterized protein at3g28850 n=1 Tax=Phtheirospermum japonicum TaxID=374723 RepID=A0A830CYT2_9LAMI|nr:uncharacterized protein at3g28850 [Phtheirospermum japonicum]